MVLETETFGVAGACGSANSNVDLGVALNMQLFDSADYCGKTVKITTSEGSRSAQATVIDRCGPGGTCSNEGGIDATNALFAKLGGDIDTTKDLSLDSVFGYGHIKVDFEILDTGDLVQGKPRKHQTEEGGPLD